MLIIDSGWTEKQYTPVQFDPVLELWRWRFYPELKGKGLRCMVEDKNGLMWFGTDVGLYQYDGLDWTLWSTKEGLPDSSVTCLLVTNNDQFYVGTRWGVSRLAHGHWENIFSFVGDMAWDRYDMVEGKDGSVWVETRYGALRIKSSTFTLYTTEKMRSKIQKNFRHPSIIGYRTHIPEDTPPHDNVILTLGDRSLSYEIHYIDAQQSVNVQEFQVYDILEDQDGVMWFGLKSGLLARFDINIYQSGGVHWLKFYTRESNIHSDKNTHMLQTADGMIWVVSESKSCGVYQLYNNVETRFYLSDMGGSDRNLSIIQTRDGTVWISGSQALHTFRNGIWHVYHYSTEDIPVSTNRTFLLEASDGAIWMGGQGQEAVRFDYASPLWKSYKDLIYQGETPDGYQWFLSKDGEAVRFDGTGWMSYNVEDGLMDTPVVLFVARKGDLWAAGSHAGNAATARFKHGHWTLQQYPLLSWSIGGRAVFEDREGNVWFGGSVDPFPERGHLGGLLRFRPYGNSTVRSGEWDHFHPPEAPQSAYGIGQTRDGHIWVSGWYGIRCFDGEHWFAKNINGLNKLRGDAILTDNRGEIWVGTRSHGILHFNDSTWVQYDTKNGLLDNDIQFLCQTYDGSVWASTQKGFHRYFPNGSQQDQMDAWFHDVLPAELPFFDWTSLRQSRDGALWLNYSTENWNKRAQSQAEFKIAERARFYTVRYLPDQAPPETYITKYLDKVSQPGNAIISWNGIDRWNETRPDELRYTYRMDEGPWSSFSPEMNKTFLSLCSGNHTLEVRAIDRHFNVDPTPAVARFEVIPPVYKQLWFIALVILLCVAVVTQTVRIVSRGQRLLHANRELQDALTNIKTLEGLLPICSSCKKIRDDQGYWKQIESYIRQHSNADFTHGICPECLDKLYLEMKETHDRGNG